MHAAVHACSVVTSIMCLQGYTVNHLSCHVEKLEIALVYSCDFGPIKLSNNWIRINNLQLIFKPEITGCFKTNKHNRPVIFSNKITLTNWFYFTNLLQPFVFLNYQASSLTGLSSRTDGWYTAHHSIVDTVSYCTLFLNNTCMVSLLHCLNTIRQQRDKVTQLDTSHYHKDAVMLSLL